MCWRYNKKLGMYLHLWWECEVIQRVWKEVFKEIREILEVNTELPRTILLLIDNHNVNNSKKGIIINMITAAQLLIAKNGRRTGFFNHMNGIMKSGILQLTIN